MLGLDEIAEADRNVREFGCGACQGLVESIGPLQGPKRPRWRAERWSMSPEEWAGQE